MRSGFGRLATFVVTSALASAQLAGNCVDGVTPDCSDPVVCAPSVGDAAPDTGTTPDTGVGTGPDADARDDAGNDAEAGDAADRG